MDKATYHYKQIAQELGEQIESGKIGPGDHLPTELELRSQYDASRNTIRDAIKLLIASGLVETRPGQGTFAAKRTQPYVSTLAVDLETGLSGVEGEAAFAEIERSGRCPAASVPRVEVGRARPEVAARLRVPAESQVITRRQERLVDGIPWSLQVTEYPMELASRGADALLVARDITDGAVAYIQRTLGIEQIGRRDTLEVRPASEEEARFFRLPDDGRMPLVSVVTRTGYRAGDDAPVPLRETSTVFLAERLNLVIDSGDVPRSDSDRSRCAAVLRVGGRAGPSDAP
jgi:GntR family transcriptional regulator